MFSEVQALGSDLWEADIMSPAGRRVYWILLFEG